MRILYIVPWLFKQPCNTASEYHVELINALAQRNHDVVVVCFSLEPEKLKSMESEHITINALTAPLSHWGFLPLLFRSLVKTKPISISKYDQQQFQGMIKKILRLTDNLNVALLEHIEVAQYATIIQKAGLPILLHLIDIEAQKYSLAARTSPSLFIKIGAWIESRRMLRYEIEVVREFNTAFLSEFDKKFIRKYLPHTEMDVIPFAINLDKYIFNPTPVRNGKIVFVGPADYYKNALGVRWFLEHVYPHVLRLWPEAIFRVINVRQGSEMDRYIRRFPRTETVEFVDNVFDEIGNASVTVAPMRVASGISGRVVSSLALGSPLIATSLACQGLSVQSGEHLWIADDPLEFSRRVVAYGKTMSEQQLQMLIKGRSYVEHNHDIRQVAEMIEKKFSHYVIG